ncbi:MAG: hypothetical protein IBJ16_06255 [Chitinophagaceae bacterium]|nr:hypothetical protein [Chitinophagaceae bacterium]
MENTYYTLQTLYRIVREEPHPEHYLCTPREMILHSTFGWDTIHKHLQALAQQGLVMLQQLDTPHCYITTRGIETVKSSLVDQDNSETIGLLVKKEAV